MLDIVLRLFKGEHGHGFGESMKYEFIDDGKSAVCEKILRALPDWFGIESATKAYIEKVRKLPVIVARDQSDVVGFLALEHHNPWTSEIHVMGVLPQYQRRGVGRGLVLSAENQLRDQGIQFLTVKTLSGAPR